MSTKKQDWILLNVVPISLMPEKENHALAARCQS